MMGIDDWISAGDCDVIIRGDAATAPAIAATSVKKTRRVTIRQSHISVNNRRSNQQQSVIYLAHAYASTLGSAPALTDPVFASTMMAASEAIDHGPSGRPGNLWPCAASV